MDILEMLKKHGVEIAEDKVADFNKDFRTSYKSVAEHKKLKDELAELQNKVNGNTDFEGKYNTLLKKYETDLAAKQTEVDDFKFNVKLDKALNGVEFASGRVKDSVVSEIKAKGFKVADSGEIEGLTDYLKELYKNEPDNFKSVDSKVHTWFGGSTDTTVAKAEPKKSWVL